MYVHGQTTRRPATEAGLAAQRAKNAALAAELRQLEAIGERLTAAVTEAKQRLEQERDQARAELDQLRAERTDLSEQSRDLIRYRARMAELPPPVYGGREGLLAAADEIDAHTNPGRGNTHGTKRRYFDDGCRCAACETWHEGHKARAKQRYRNSHAPARRLELAA